MQAWHEVLRGGTTQRPSNSVGKAGRLLGRAIQIALASATLGASIVGAASEAARPQAISPGSEPASASQVQASTREHRANRYQLQSQDVLTLSFPLSPEFNETVTVQPDGYIALVGAGELRVQGLTIPETRDALQNAYKKVLNHPIIDVDLKDFQTPFFVVSGQVAKPGQFTLRYDTTVSEAIALAGGLTPAAKSRIFLLRHSSEGWFKVTPLNLKDIVSGKPVEDALVQTGDMIYVPQNFITRFRTYVPYSLGFYTSPQFVF